MEENIQKLNLEKSTAVIIGRFQTPYLHLGHIYLISYALQNFDKVYILLGTLPNEEVDEKNPYDLFYRVRNITSIFNHNRVVWDRLTDVPGNDQLWSKKVDMILSKISNPVLLHSRDSFKNHYSGIYPLHEVPELPGYSGTELRKQFSHAGINKGET